MSPEAPHILWATQRKDATGDRGKIIGEGLQFCWVLLWTSNRFYLLHMWCLTGTKYQLMTQETA